MCAASTAQVQDLNQSLAPPPRSTLPRRGAAEGGEREEEEGERAVGLLDIFGFESLATNGFEQLCINYANESLHALFLSSVFRGLTQAQLAPLLGGDAALALDRGPCLDLIAAPPRGILPLLDHQCRAPKGSDAAFAASVNQTHADSAHLVVPRLSRTSRHDDASAFVVVHFAGEVLYEVRAFLGANHDTLHSAGGSAAAWLAGSTRPHIAALFSATARPALQRSRSTFASVGQQFATDLASLLATLQNADSVHYVRCLKPNGQQRPRTFDPTFVRGRLRAAGTQAALAILTMALPTYYDCT